MATLLCDFRLTTGWRTVAHTTETNRSVCVVVHGGKKLLSIPSSKVVGNGRFCNPKKVTLNYVRQKHTMCTSVQEAKDNISTLSKRLLPHVTKCLFDSRATNTDYREMAVVMQHMQFYCRLNSRCLTESEIRSSVQPLDMSNLECLVTATDYDFWNLNSLEQRGVYAVVCSVYDDLIRLFTSDTVSGFATRMTSARRLLLTQKP